VDSQGAIKIGRACLAAPLLGEAARRRAGYGRPGEPLRELASALNRHRGADAAIVLGAGVGEPAADLAAGDIEVATLGVEGTPNSYALLTRNAPLLSVTPLHAVIADSSPSSDAPAVSFDILLERFPSFREAQLLVVAGSQDGPDAIASAYAWIRSRLPLIVLEIRLGNQPSERWARSLESLAQLGYDGGLVFDDFDHPLGWLGPGRASELLGSLGSARAHGGGFASLTFILAAPSHQEILDEVRARMATRTAAGSMPAAGSVRRIAVVRLDNLGDHVLGAGLFPVLRSSFPAAKIVAVIPSALAELYARCAEADAILTVPPATMYFSSKAQWAQLLQSFRDSPRFDLVINPRFAEDWYGAGAICSVLASPEARLIGFRQDAMPLNGYDPNAQFRELLDAPATLHAARYAGVMAQAVTGHPASAPPAVWWLPSDWDRVARRHALAPREFVVVGIGASGANKLPPLDIYRQLIRYLLASTAFPVVLVGSAGEHALADALRAAFPADGRIVAAAGTLALYELAALLAHARLYVGPDAGPKHMAAASRTPVVEIAWVPEDFPVTSRGDGTAGLCWSPWDTTSRIVYPDRDAYIRASSQPDYRQRALAGIDQRLVEQAIQALLAMPSDATRSPQAPC
jgi:heptosyltransferase-2